MNTLAFINNTERIIIYIASNVSISIFLLMDNKRIEPFLSLFVQLMLNASAYILDLYIYVRCVPSVESTT